MQQALHPRQQSAVGHRIPLTPFVEFESTSANVFSKTTRRVIEDLYHSDIVV